MQTSDRAVVAKQERFAYADAIRGLAALWVVFRHASHELPDLLDAIPRPVAKSVFESGYLGVACFFVLSGFVMANTIRKERTDGSFVGRFMIGRFVRLTPPYYVAIALAITSAGFEALLRDEPFLPGGAPLSIGRLVVHALYLQDVTLTTPMITVLWTLTKEMQFYLVFAGLLWAAHRLAPGDERVRLQVFGAATAVATAFLISPFELSDRLDATCLPLLYSFLVGVWIYWSRTSRVATVVSWVLLAVMMTESLVRGHAFAALAAGTGVALYVCSRRPGRTGWSEWRGLKGLAAISYSLYLIHVVVLGIVQHGAFGAFGDTLAGQAVYLVVGVTASIAAATVLWWAVERPSQTWARRVKAGRRRVA
ncbi:MAG: acyltransferase family protein [Acidimicrobiia bacterium]